MIKSWARLRHARACVLTTGYRKNDQNVPSKASKSPISKSSASPRESIPAQVLFKLVVVVVWFFFFFFFLLLVVVVNLSSSATYAAAAAAAFFSSSFLLFSARSIFFGSFDGDCGSFKFRFLFEHSLTLFALVSSFFARFDIKAEVNRKRV